MSRPSLRRRALASLVALAILGGPALATSGAAGDPISDKRAEAARVADRLEALEQKAELLTEAYNDARLALADVEAKVAEALTETARTQASLDARRSDLAVYAVDSYIRGEDASEASVVLDAEDGNEVGQRQGYAAAAIGDKADLIDRLRGAKAAAEADARALTAARALAAKAEAAVEAKREAAADAVAEQGDLLAEVRGELASLVEAEKARRAAAAARQAREAARRLAAQQAAAQAEAVRQTTTTTQPPATAQPEPEPEDAPSDPPPTDPGPPVGEGAGAAIAAARSVIGVRYTWAGASPSTGFDCSGLVMWAWQHGGKSLPHSSRAMYSSSRRIPMSEIQPGDLIFYGQPTIHHVALYIGGGQIIHAPSRGDYVRLDSVYYWDELVGAGRV